MFKHAKTCLLIGLAVIAGLAVTGTASTRTDWFRDVPDPAPHGEEIDTARALRESLRSIDYSRVGLSEADVKPFHYGTGPREVAAFVDPYCPDCRQFFAAIRSDPAYAGQFSWAIYVIPDDSDRSTRAVAALNCATDRKAALTALMDQDEVYYQRAFDAHGDGCDPEPTRRGMILAHMIGATDAPYIIGPRGGVSNGMPPNLAAFLQVN